MTTTTTIGTTAYTIKSIDGSTCSDIDLNAHITGPRGGEKLIIGFSNGCVRVVSISRGCMPRGHKDIWGDEANRIREELIAAA